MDDPNEDEGAYDFNTPLAVASVVLLVIVAMVDYYAPKHGEHVVSNVQLVKEGH